MRALIAGCGYVGSALAVRLARSGHEVFALRRSDARIGPGVQLVRADLTSSDTLRSLLPAGVDTVFYTAAPDGGSESAYRATYVDGLGNLLIALRSSPPRRVLVTTSTAVYEQDAGEWVDEDSPTEPRRYQGRVLLESEALARGSGIRAVAVRFGGIYGPGRTRLIAEVRSGSATIPDRPSYTNRIHRDDCAGVLQHLAELPEPATVYVGVDNDPADRRDLMAWLAGELGATPPRVEHLEGPPARGKRCRNARLLASGYRFTYPSFREGYLDVLAALDANSRSSD